MTSRHFSKYADPDKNYQFNRVWDEPRQGLQQIGLPANRILGRIERQRTRSHLAKCLQAAQLADGDAEVVLTAFAMADQCRRALGVSWQDIVIGASR